MNSKHNISIFLILWLVLGSVCLAGVDWEVEKDVMEPGEKNIVYDQVNGYTMTRFTSNLIPN